MYGFRRTVTHMERGLGVWLASGAAHREQLKPGLCPALIALQRKSTCLTMNQMRMFFSKVCSEGRYME